MLCDRATNNVASSQPGFIGFVPLPLFISMSNVLPELSEVVTQMKNNKENWKNYVETDDDKKIYAAKKQINVVLDKDIDSEEEHKTNNK